LIDPNVASDLRIDKFDLDEEIMRNPGLTEHYYRLAEDAELAAKHVKLKLEVFEAAIDAQIRDQFRARNIKPTEKQIEMAMRLNPQWERLKKDTFEADARAGQMKGLAKSIADRKDLIVTFSANKRSEMTAGYTTRRPDEIPLVQAGNVKN